MFRGSRQNSNKAAEPRRAIVFIASAMPHRVMLGAAELPSGVPSNDGHFIGTGMSCSDPILHLVLVNYRMIGGYDMDTAPTNLPGVSLAVVVKQNPQQL